MIDSTQTTPPAHQGARATRPLWALVVIAALALAWSVYRDLDTRERELRREEIERRRWELEDDRHVDELMRRVDEVMDRVPADVRASVGIEEFLQSEDPRKREWAKRAKAQLDQARGRK